MQKTLKIKNDIRQLAAVERFLRETADSFGWSEPLVGNLDLVLEEAVSNIIFYAYEGEEREEEIELSLCYEQPHLIIELSDGGCPFDPTARQDPDISLATEERPVGGLGIFLIKKLMDEVSYKRVGDKNVLILKKKITS